MTSMFFEKKKKKALKIQVKNALKIIMVLNILRVQIALHHLVLWKGWPQDCIAAAYFIVSMY